MKVRLLTSRVGYGFAQSSGDLIEVSPEDGRRMVAAGQAERIEERIETAAIDNRSREQRKHSHAR